MYVICKSCSHHIPVAGRPSGGTNLKDVRASGNVRIEGGSISFGPGGSIAFGPGGSMSFGSAPDSTFCCPKCGDCHDYSADEIKDD